MTMKPRIDGTTRGWVFTKNTGGHNLLSYGQCKDQKGGEDFTDRFLASDMNILAQDRMPW
jgi:hypothetical protein